MMDFNSIFWSGFWIFLQLCTLDINEKVNFWQYSRGYFAVYCTFVCIFVCKIKVDGITTLMQPGQEAGLLGVPAALVRQEVVVGPPPVLSCCGHESLKDLR